MRTTVLVPASLVAETDDGRRRAHKVGQVARALAVFRCDRVVVYDDDPDHGEEIATLLRYAATAPYLRKAVFGRRAELEHAGVVPPLGIPPHRTGASADDADGPEIRQGVVTEVGSDGRAWVTCGLQHPVAVRGTDAAEGERVTVRIASRDPLRAEVVDPDAVPVYTGFAVERAPIDDWCAAHDGDLVALSRDGDRATVDDFSRRDDVALVFGAPGRGVRAILADLDASVAFDAVLNTVPDQGVATVRTEEAVWATLAVANVASTQE
jgi:hypothetical protein